MLMGFMSFLLTLFQESISNICISRKIASHWRPCASYKDSPQPPKDSDFDSNSGDSTKSRNLLKLSDFISRRFLATKGYDACPQAIL